MTDDELVERVVNSDLKWSYTLNEGYLGKGDGLAVRPTSTQINFYTLRLSDYSIADPDYVIKDAVLAKRLRSHAESEIKRQDELEKKKGRQRVIARLRKQ